MSHPDRSQATQVLEERLAAARDEVRRLEMALARHGGAPPLDPGVADGDDALEARLRESERRLQVISDTVPFPVVATRIDDGTVLYANRAFAEFFGTPLEETVGARAVDHYARPEQRDELLRRLRRDGRVDGLEVELRCGDGSLRTASCSAVPLVIDGVPALMGAAADISELKAREGELRELGAQKDLLLHEVNHRVRNNLATLMVLIRQQRAVADRSGRLALEQVERNVQGLAVVHDKLSEVGWRPIGVIELCRDLVQSTVGASVLASAVHVSGEGGRVASQAAHRLALVLVELATNSIKHAGKGTELRVDIAIEVAGDRMWITYRDNGGGFPARVINAGERGAGMQLVEGLVSYGLSGSVAFGNDSGARTTLCLPHLSRMDDAGSRPDAAAPPKRGSRS